jgi:tetratricopeptide (TPR) repeat protein
MALSATTGAMGRDNLYQQGLTKHEAGELTEALKLYNRFLDNNPNHKDARYARGLASFETGDVMAAQNDFEWLVKRYPDDYRSILMLAKASLAAGMAEESKDLFRKTLRRYPKNIDAMIGMGEAEYALGNRFTGEDWLRRALELEPDNEPLRRAFREIKDLNRKYLAKERKRRRQAVLAKLNQAIWAAGREWTRRYKEVKARQELLENEIAIQKEIAAAGAPEVIVEKKNYYYPYYPYKPQYRSGFTQPGVTNYSFEYSYQRRQSLPLLPWAVAP